MNTQEEFQYVCDEIVARIDESADQAEEFDLVGLQSLISRLGELSRGLSLSRPPMRLRRGSHGLSLDLCWPDGTREDFRLSYQGANASAVEAMQNGEDFGAVRHIKNPNDSVVRALRSWLRYAARQIAPTDGKHTESSHVVQTVEHAADATPLGADTPATDSGGKSPAAPLSPRQLAAKHDLAYDAIRGRLERFRQRNHHCFVEVSDAKPQEPRFLYYEAAVRHIIDELKSTKPK